MPKHLELGLKTHRVPFLFYKARTDYGKGHEPNVVIELTEHQGRRRANAQQTHRNVFAKPSSARSAREPRRGAALENFQPLHAAIGLGNHLVPELYYYAQPFDPRRRGPESSATFAPQPKVVNVSSALVKKLKAAQGLKTINHSTAMRIKDRLESTGRRLPLLGLVNDDSVHRLVEINVRKLGEIAAKGTSHKYAEEFLYAGVEYQIPFIYLK